MESTLPSANSPKTFKDCFNQEFKQHYAYRLEKETGHRSELDVQIETTIEADNARIITTADIVLYNTSGPHSVVNFLVESQPTPSPPSTQDLARVHAQMDGLAGETDRPPAVIISIGLDGGTLKRYPFEFDTSSWNNLYKFLLADAGAELSE